MTLSEYTEKLCADAFKRETDQEENVVRSLPFFATALALSVTIIGYILRTPPAVEWTFYSAFFYGVLVAAGACFLCTLCCLAVAVAARQYRLPPRETETLDWAEALKSFYATQAGTHADQAALDEVREALTREFAEATVHNREQNLKRSRARTLGLTFLLGLLTLAFLLVATMFVHEHIVAPSGRGQHGGARSAQREVGLQHRARQPHGEVRAGQRVRQADAATLPSGREGRAVPRDSGAGESSQMSDAKKPAAPAVPAQQQPVKPPAPQAQLLKKSIDSPGGERR